MAPKTKIFKFIFIVLVLLSLVFSLISLFTPAWRIYQFHKSQISLGLVSYECYDNNHWEIAEARIQEEVVVSAFPKTAVANPSSNIVAADNTVATRVARKVVDEAGERRSVICDSLPVVRHNYENATTLLVILAIFTLTIALLTACVLQCLTPRFYWISPVLGFIAAILLITSILIYTINADKYSVPVLTPTAVIVDNNREVVARENYLPYSFGYSFWFAFTAMITTVTAAIFGFMASANYGEEHTSRLLVQSYITSATK